MGTFLKNKRAAIEQCHARRKGLLQEQVTQVSHATARAQQHPSSPPHRASHHEVGPAIANMPLFLALFAVAVWIVIALVAAAVAPDDRRITFFLITLFFLGPIGIAAASIAQPRTVPTSARIPKKKKNNSAEAELQARLG